MRNRLPEWFRQEVPPPAVLERQKKLSSSGVLTVCREARCPNAGRCLHDGRLTFMILGNACTRQCGFCGVNKAGDRPLTVDHEEPHRISLAVKSLGLTYCVVTSVTRDDLSDGGAAHFKEVIASIRSLNGDIGIETLIPDFSGNFRSLKTVVEASPSVIAHNIETIRRLYPAIRPQADYGTSLELLLGIKEIDPRVVTKSSLMVGLGEQETEVVETMRDLRGSRCDIVTLGQYLAPRVGSCPVREFVRPEQFRKYERIGKELGFKAVLSGPLVRSSYQAEAVYRGLRDV